MPFAVVDLETTGLFPKHDRVIEVAVVNLADDCTLTDEWSTLVNPDRDVGPTDIHGITASDVRSAPRFHDVCGDLAHRLQGCVLVAHNIKFDLGFLEREFRRARVSMPSVVSLCTLALAYELEPDAARRRLPDCCQRAGITVEQWHSALEDAKLTARLLDAYIEMANASGVAGVLETVARAHAFPKEPWHDFPPPSGRHLSRQLARIQEGAPESYLKRLIQRLPADEAPGPAEAQYLNLLDRALEDRRITLDESQLLIEEATRYGLSPSRVQACHYLYLSSLVRRANADGLVTPEERTDLEFVAELLGIARSGLEALLPTSPSVPATEEGLRGKRICFTGASLCRLNGYPLTRELAEELAERSGVLVVSTVTKKTDLVVAHDPETMSGKGRKAREYGIQIMRESEFWAALNIPFEQ